jgi:hypothetical protein
MDEAGGDAASRNETVLDAQVIENESFWVGADAGAPSPVAEIIPKKAKKPRLILAATLAGGGLLAMVLICGGIASSGRSSNVAGDGDPKGAASDTDPFSSAGAGPPPAQSYDPYSSSNYVSTPAAEYAPSQDYAAPQYTQAPSIAADGSYGAASTPTPLWNFSVDRASELRSAIAQDQARLKDLDILITGAGAGSFVGEMAAGNEDNWFDRLAGPFVREGAETARRRWQTERDEVQIRLNANLAELARLEQGY